jgi:hypothetical protein
MKVKPTGNRKEVITGETQGTSKESFGEIQTTN